VRAVARLEERDFGRGAFGALMKSLGPIDEVMASPDRRVPAETSERLRCMILNGVGKVLLSIQARPVQARLLNAYQISYIYSPEQGGQPWT